MEHSNPVFEATSPFHLLTRGIFLIQVVFPQVQLKLSILIYFISNATLLDS